MEGDRSWLNQSERATNVLRRMCVCVYAGISPIHCIKLCDDDCLASLQHNFLFGIQLSLRFKIIFYLKT